VSDASRRYAAKGTAGLASLNFQYTDELDQLTANVLFADGAAAMMISPQPSDTQVLACRCVSVPERADQMVWFADDHGLRLRLSQDLPDTLAAAVPGMVASFLADNGTTCAAVNHWLVHPAGPQILDAVQRALGLPEDALRISRSVLRRHGNMSSPTIFFILGSSAEFVGGLWGNRRRRFPQALSWGFFPLTGGGPDVDRKAIVRISPLGSHRKIAKPTGWNRSRGPETARSYPRILLRRLQVKGGE
jgi:prepilin-type processing-associated H-X9-DG protein